MIKTTYVIMVCEFHMAMASYPSSIIFPFHLRVWWKPHFSLPSFGKCKKTRYGNTRPNHHSCKRLTKTQILSKLFREILRLSKEKFDIDIFLWTVKITGMFKLRATVICNSWPHWNSELFLVNDGVMSHFSQTDQHCRNLSWLAWYKTAKSIAAPLGLDASPTQITSLVIFH